MQNTISVGKQYDTLYNKFNMKPKRERTKQKIKDHYIELLMVKSPSEITVSEICKKCRINRSTFYEYYSYIDLLIDDVVGDQIDAISIVNDVLYDEYYIENTTGPDHVARYMENVAGNKVLMRLITCDEANRFKAIITRKQCEYEVNRYNITDLDKRIQVVYRNSGVLSVVYRWIELKNESDLMEIATRLYNEIRKTENN